MRYHLVLRPFLFNIYQNLLKSDMDGMNSIE